MLQLHLVLVSEDQRSPVAGISLDLRTKQNGVNLQVAHMFLCTTPSDRGLVRMLKK